MEASDLMPTNQEWLDAMAEVIGVVPNPDPGFFTVANFCKHHGTSSSQTKSNLDRAVLEGKMEKKIFRTKQGQAAHYRIIDKPTKKKK